MLARRFLWVVAGLVVLVLIGAILFRLYGTEFMRLRDAYTEDCAKGVERWNKLVEKTGVAFRLELPSVAFNRGIGEFRNTHATPQGTVVDVATWARTRDDYLPVKAGGKHANVIDITRSYDFKSGKHDYQLTFAGNWLGNLAKLEAASTVSVAPVTFSHTGQ